MAEMTGAGIQIGIRGTDAVPVVEKSTLESSTSEAVGPFTRPPSTREVVRVESCVVVFLFDEGISLYYSCLPVDDVLLLCVTS